MWKQINESSNGDVKALLQQAIEIANPTLKGVLQKVIDKYLNIPEYNRQPLETWQQMVKTLRSTLPEMGKGSMDYENQKEQIGYLREDKPDFVYWYYSDSERVGSEEIEETLAGTYPDYYVDNAVNWTDSEGSDVGFICMYKRK